MVESIVLAILATVIFIYFRNNPLGHSRRFMMRRFTNWFPLGMTYAFLYMARYNLAISKNALDTYMSNQQFGIIFGTGTIVYALSLFLNGPIVDRIGGKKGILLAALGASVANIAMGTVVYAFLHKRLDINLTLTLSILYSINMFFQSYGAVSIIKVKAYWFHVRERGIFGAIFGTLISFGVYFAYDWGNLILNASKHDYTGEPGPLRRFFEIVFGVNTSQIDAIWLAFFIPSFILVIWSLLDVWFIKDTPADAGYDDFDTHDASSGEMDREFTAGELLRRVLGSPLMMIFAAIEFTSGVLRNGVMQWYLIFAKAHPESSSEFFRNNWGFLLCLFGIFGGFAGGLVSDKLFHSRRGPPSAIAQMLIFVCTVVMATFLFRDAPSVVAFSCLFIAAFVITTHSLMSGTAAADFGGRKATATASGYLDACVYLGSGLQSFAIGNLVSSSWIYWPIFMAPFALIGAGLASWIWHELPEATKRYLLTVETTRITSIQGHTIVTHTEEKIEIVPTNPSH